MKALKIMVFVFMICLLLSTTLFAQRRVITDTSYIDRVQQVIAWGKDVVKNMQKQLETARRDQDMAEIECIEKRLVDIQKLLAEIQAGFNNMREHSFNKRIDGLRREFILIDQKRKILEQLVKLVNDCLGKPFHDGFTESVEEFFGIYEDDDPTFSGWEDYWPEPLPPIYEPRPASLADDE